jgi:putative transport protein
MHLVVHNEALNGKTLFQVKNFLGRDFVISRILQNGHVSIPNKDTVFHVGDQLYVVCAEDDAEAITAFIGPVIQVNWAKQDTPMVSRRILVTQSKMNGKRLGQLHFNSIYGVNVTRVNRSGMDIFASPDLTLQVGDRVMVVGPQDAVERVANLMGNSLKRLDHPNIVTIFVGIFLGILFGSLPIAFPGIPTPVKLGLAGGPLIVAILIGRFGYKLKLVTYTTMSANLMLREIGIALFLASVGVKAGANFVQTVVEGDGMLYVGCGFLITLIPLLIMGIFGRYYYKINYFKLMGLMAGSTTDPPALAYANQITGSNAPAVGYSTVYPVTMFLRILTAQLLILILAS